MRNCIYDTGLGMLYPFIRFTLTRTVWCIPNLDSPLLRHPSPEYWQYPYLGPVFPASPKTTLFMNRSKVFFGLTFSRLRSSRSFPDVLPWRVVETQPMSKYLIFFLITLNFCWPTNTMVFPWMCFAIWRLSIGQLIMTMRAKNYGM